ncbi:MAG: rhodanese-like domain-containing protein [Anaerolineales bacterium]
MFYKESLEISVQELAEKLKGQDVFYLLDVRETWELDLASLDNPRLVAVPMSQMAHAREDAFPLELRDHEAEIVVMCHHGVRSLQVTQWMRSLGWNHVLSLAGGIEAYANQIDPSVGLY